MIPNFESYKNIKTIESKNSHKYKFKLNKFGDSGHYKMDYFGNKFYSNAKNYKENK